MNSKPHRKRPSYAEEQLIELLKTHPTGQVSYDHMAAMLDYDRRTLVSVVAKLCHQGRLHIVEPGRGTTPNRYALA